MAYQALYRTWRPMRFEHVVGQDHIKKILSGQISTDKTSHAYLFAGPRGTGKTSMAKIFAAAVNCTDRDGFEPCGKCASCTSDSIDIIEIDAASNNGVDNVREIRERVNLLPALCSHKIYIIDEAHMLSKGAFNALLKTLEEPPSHVIFILATTEPHKLPPTIRSRCQRFDFRRIAVDIIAALLEKVAASEEFVYDVPALKMIARAAEGGMRDALSILDQCAAFGQIDISSVTSTLGGTDMGMVLELTSYIAKYDEKNALTALRNIIDSGADTRALIGDLANVFRAMMWIAAGADIEADDSLKPLAKTFGKNACVRALDILLQKEYEMRQNLRANIVLETAVMAIMRPSDDADATDTVRMEKLEGRLQTLEEQGVTVSAAPPAATSPKQEKQAKPQPEKQAVAEPTKHPETEPTEPKPAAAKQAEAEPSESAPKNAPLKEAAPSKQASEANALKGDEIWAKLLASIKNDSYHVYPHAKHAKQVFVVGSMLEITFDSEDEISADFMKGDVAQAAIKDKLKTIAPDVVSVSILTMIEAEEESDLNVLKMFGNDIEQI